MYQFNRLPSCTSGEIYGCIEVFIIFNIPIYNENRPINNVDGSINQSIKTPLRAPGSCLVPV